MQNSLTRIMIAEGIGTFALTFIGILALSGEMIAGNPNNPASLTVVALAHGLTLAVMIAALGSISGGHFNPAVTFGFVVTGRLRPAHGAAYWLAQILGATAAAYIIFGTAGIDPVIRGTPGVSENIGVGLAVILETITTFFLVLVVFGTAVDERAPKSVYPFAIGLTVTIGIFGTAMLTGGAMNPARALGPVLASQDWDNQWVYWVGPLLGGGLAAILMHSVLMVRAPEPAVAAHGGPSESEKRR